jgi:hypothetical protein
MNIESLHTGVSSKGDTPGRTVKIERAIYHLLNYYLNPLFNEDPQSCEIHVEDGAASLAEDRKRFPDHIDAGYFKSFDISLA